MLKRVRTWKTVGLVGRSWNGTSMNIFTFRRGKEDLPLVVGGSEDPVLRMTAGLHTDRTGLQASQWSGRRFGVRSDRDRNRQDSKDWIPGVVQCLRRVQLKDGGQRGMTSSRR